jgi:hypothetical protein
MTATMHPPGDLAILRETKSTSADEQAGMAWWNGLSEQGRRAWVTRFGVFTVADAWAAFKRDSARPVSVRQADGHADADIFADEDLPDETSISMLAVIIREDPIRAATRWLNLEAQLRVQRDHLESLENRLSGLSARIGA